MNLISCMSNPGLESRVLLVLVVVSVFLFTSKSWAACLVYYGSRDTVDKRICHISTAPDLSLLFNRKKNTDIARWIDICACLLKLFPVELVSL